jgi:signal peptidase II
LKKYLKDYLTLFSIAGTIVIIDQITKRIIQNNLAIGEVFMPDFWLSQYIRLVNWHNTGAAFGLFQNMSPVFTVLAFVVAIVIIVYYPSVPSHEWALRLAMSMQLGGAVGNLIDRLRQGYVTDFVSVGNFPVFNVADASISMGCVVLFIGLWMSERKQTALGSAEETESPVQDPIHVNKDQHTDDDLLPNDEGSIRVSLLPATEAQEFKEAWSEDEEYQS